MFDFNYFSSKKWEDFRKKATKLHSLVGKTYNYITLNVNYFPHKNDFRKYIKSSRVRN